MTATLGMIMTIVVDNGDDEKDGGNDFDDDDEVDVVVAKRYVTIFLVACNGGDKAGFCWW